MAPLGEGVRPPKFFWSYELELLWNMGKITCLTKKFLGVGYPLPLPRANIRNFESNRIVTCYSIRNWRNYSKFSNTYLTVISRATEMRFVYTLPATSRCTHLSPSAAPLVFLLLPLPWSPHGSCCMTAACGSSRACVLPAPARPWHLIAL